MPLVKGFQSVGSRSASEESEKDKFKLCSTESAACDVTDRGLFPLENFCESVDQGMKVKITPPTVLGSYSNGYLQLPVHKLICFSLPKETV